ncbi:threonine/serine exporter family protein [Dehalobacterium formicoaceticum]|uniref:Threonine/serine exporter family protein n=1 Tax=Dehalobacterium formicoaceticum TaxID=51515 RepID=A0ABT1Y056_9FIRM|nr:threonine/serine exporter family protein [Dehalobacterium formicoaceticum]MCR6544247.1 threonine/serine exporter family protein [Dehalobacterium formicoaceticum]
MMSIIQIFTAFLAALGFAMLYNVRGIKLLYAAIGGLLSWSVNLLAGYWLHHEAFQFFIAAFSVTIYAEICARINKTPTTTFLPASIIPLVPGGALYYSMQYAVNSMLDEFLSRSLYTASLAIAIAAGILLASSIWKVWLTALNFLESGLKRYK